METVISDDLFGFKFRYYKNDYMASDSIGINKEWEPHIRNFIEYYNSLYDIKNIIDIGANFGYHSLLFSRECHEMVYSFDPQIQNYELLEENVKLNNISNIILHNYGCGDENCNIRMPIFNDTNRKLNMGDITPNVNISSNFHISKSIRLDDYNFTRKIDVIKIDVQGWEKKVLIGAIELLQKHKPILIIEFENFQLNKVNTSCKELFDVIRENNYYIFYLEYVYPCDHVCVHNDNLLDFRLKFKDMILPHNIDNNLNNNVINGVNEKLLMNINFRK